MARVDELKSQKILIMTSTPRRPIRAFFIRFQVVATGVDVMITIFCDFDAFRRKNWRFSKKNQCYDQNFALFSFSLSQNRQFFRRIFRQKYF
jgi:hypothetical protein